MEECSAKEWRAGDQRGGQETSASKNGGAVETTNRGSMLDGEGVQREEPRTSGAGRGARSFSREDGMDSVSSMGDSSCRSGREGVLPASSREGGREGDAVSSGQTSSSSCSSGSDPPGAATEQDGATERYSSGGGNGGLVYDLEMMGLGFGAAVQGTSLLDGNDEDALMLGGGGGVMLGSRDGDDEQLLLFQHQRSPFVVEDDLIIDGDAVFQKMLLVANCLFLLLDLLPAHAAAAIVKSRKYTKNSCEHRWKWLAKRSCERT